MYPYIYRTFNKVLAEFFRFHSNTHKFPDPRIFILIKFSVYFAPNKILYLCVVVFRCCAYSLPLKIVDTIQERLKRLC